MVEIEYWFGQLFFAHGNSKLVQVNVRLNGEQYLNMLERELLDWVNE